MTPPQCGRLILPSLTSSHTLCNTPVSSNKVRTLLSLFHTNILGIFHHKATAVIKMNNYPLSNLFFVNAKSVVPPNSCCDFFVRRLFKVTSHNLWTNKSVYLNRFHPIFITDWLVNHFVRLKHYFAHVSHYCFESITGKRLKLFIACDDAIVIYIPQLDSEQDKIGDTN